MNCTHLVRFPALARLLVASTVLAAVSLSAQPAAPTSAAAPKAPPVPRLPVPAASPLGTLKQRVGLTDIEIVYARPGAKGRTMLGNIEPYGKVWRTGANAATTVAFSTAVKLEGRDVPAGKYALFTIPGEKEWTVIISKDAEQSGAFEYKESDDLVRFTVKPVQLSVPVETLEFTINDIRGDSATLNLSWETTRVPVRLTLDVVGPTVAKIKEMMAAEGRKPFAAAAGFYFDNKLDLAQALIWIDASIAEGANQTNTHLKAKILAGLGRKAEAIAAANQSIELALKSPNAGIQQEYTKMNQNLIKSLK